MIYQKDTVYSLGTIAQPSACAGTCYLPNDRLRAATTEGSYIFKKVIPGWVIELTPIEYAQRQLSDIEASLNRVINQIRASCIEVDSKRQYLEELNEMAFEIHHLTPVSHAEVEAKP